MVEPINLLLHRNYPAALVAMDRNRLRSIYGGMQSDSAEQDYLRTVEPFQTIEYANCVIEELVPDDETNGYAASVVLRVDGIDRESRRMTLVENRTVRCALRDGSWSVVSFTTESTNRDCQPSVEFTEESENRGLRFSHRSTGVPGRSGDRQPYLPGSGATVRDVDNDGFDDVLLVSGEGPRLFLNRNGRFQDETEPRGLRPTDGEGRYGVFGDIDNDGDADLFVGVLNGSAQLYINETHRDKKPGHFRSIDPQAVGISASPETTGACFADFNEDGWLDLYLANGANLLVAKPTPIYNAKNGAANQLFLNRGDGTFFDATESAGVDDSGWALACSTCDYDNDGHVDLFIANDFGRDVLYRNRGDGTFDDVSDDAGIVHRGSSMGVSFGDLNGDLRPDLFVTGMASNSAWMLAQPGFPAPAPFPVNVIIRSTVLSIMKEMLHGNRLYLNQGDGTFVEVSVASGTRNSGWAWGGILFDSDNDADLDVYVPNGLLSGEIADDL